VVAEEAAVAVAVAAVAHEEDGGGGGAFLFLWRAAAAAAAFLPDAAFAGAAAEEEEKEGAAAAAAAARRTLLLRLLMCDNKNNSSKWAGEDRQGRRPILPALLTFRTAKIFLVDLWTHVSEDRTANLNHTVISIGTQKRTFEVHCWEIEPEAMGSNTTSTTPDPAILRFP
jgi:hypothetical protein